MYSQKKYNVMTKEQLQSEISSRFASNSDFISAFNALGGSLSLDVISHQLAGRRGLSKMAVSAYTFFFKLHDLTTEQ
jgi:hypothetical protein